MMPLQQDARTRSTDSSLIHLPFEAVSGRGLEQASTVMQTISISLIKMTFSLYYKRNVRIWQMSKWSVWESQTE